MFVVVINTWCREYYDHVDHNENKKIIYEKLTHFIAETAWQVTNFIKQQNEESTDVDAKNEVEYFHVIIQFGFKRLPMYNVIESKQRQIHQTAILKPRKMYMNHYEIA